MLTSGVILDGRVSDGSDPGGLIVVSKILEGVSVVVSVGIGGDGDADGHCGPRTRSHSCNAVGGSLVCIHDDAGYLSTGIEEIVPTRWSDGNKVPTKRWSVNFCRL